MLFILWLNYINSVGARQHQQRAHVPVSVWTTIDVSTSCRLADRSHEAVTTCRPSTNQSAAMTTARWPDRVTLGTCMVGNSEGADEVWLSVPETCRCVEGNGRVSISLDKLLSCDRCKVGPRRRHLNTPRPRATHADIWWRLGARKLHHVAPDVSRPVPGGWRYIM